MIPLGLSLKNFLSYGENAPSLDFRQFRLACLSGKNGHGKSALLDALIWALWGQCRVSSKVEVIRHGASEAMVEYEFEVDGVRYKIVRTVKRRKGGAVAGALYLHRYDSEENVFKRVEEGRNAQTMIERELLRMDYNSFLCSSFILQGKADEFMKRKPAERKEVLGKFLNLDRYDALSKRAREEFQRVKIEAEGVEREAAGLLEEIAQRGELEGLLKGSEAALGGLNIEVAKLEGSYEEIVRKAEFLKARLDEYGSRSRELKELVTVGERLSDRMAQLEAQIGNDSKIVEKSEEITAGFARYERKKSEVDAYSERLMSHSRVSKELERVKGLLKEEKSGLESELSGHKGRAAALAEVISQRKAVVERTKEIEEGYGEFLRTEAQEREMGARAGKALALKGRRVELDGKLNEVRVELEGRLRDSERNTEERLQKIGALSSVSARVEELEKEVRNLHEEQERSQSLRNELKSVGGELGVSRTRVDECRKRMDEDREKIALVKHDYDHPQCPLCESDLSLEAKEALIEKLERSLMRTEKELAGGEARVRELVKKEEELMRGVAAAEERLKGLSALMSELGEKRGVLADIAKSRRELEFLQERCEGLRGVLDRGDYGQELRSQIESVDGEIERLGYDEAIHKELKERLEQLRGFRSEKETLEAARKEIKSSSEELASIEGEVKRLGEVIEKGEFAEELRGRQTELEMELKGIGYDEDEYRAIKEELSELEAYLNQKQELERARSSLERSALERKNLERDMSEADERKKTLERQIAELSVVVEGGKGIQEEKSRVEGELNRLKGERDYRLKEVTKLQSRLERIGELDKRKKELASGLKELKREHSIYQQLQRAYGKNGIQAFIIESAVPDIEREANDILKRLTDGTMSLRLELVEPTQKGGVKETLQIKIGDSAGTRNYETYSGGEAFRIDFALRVAISKFIANSSGAELRTLVIDEGFGTQDRDGLEQFVQVIDSIKDDFEKILVITHVDELKDRFPVRIEVTKEYGTGSTFSTIYN